MKSAIFSLGLFSFGRGAVVLASLLLLFGGAVAGDDHEQARQAVEQGRVLPLHAILANVEHEFQGQVLGVEFEHERGHGRDAGGRQEVDLFVYKIRLLQRDGRVVKLKVDASNGRVLGVKRREH